jgi:hypothetical protein
LYYVGVWWQEKNYGAEGTSQPKPVIENRRTPDSDIFRCQKNKETRISWPHTMIELLMSDKSTATHESPISDAAIQIQQLQEG